MRRFHAAAGWAIVAIGVLHVLVTFVGYETPSLSALWFAGSGLTVILIGALHVLAATAARHLKAVRAVAVGASAAGLALAAAFSLLTRWREPQGIALLGLFLVAGACALLSPEPPRAAEAPLQEL